MRLPDVTGGGEDRIRMRLTAKGRGKSEARARGPATACAGGTRDPESDDKLVVN